MKKEWYTIDNQEDIESPAFLIFPKIIEENIQTCIDIAGSTKRLRPHVKTHKLPQVIQMHLQKGINKFKCATLAEAQMLIDNGVQDILMAYPMYGPGMKKYIQLAESYPGCTFSVLVDQLGNFKEWETLLQERSQTLKLFLDINNGMNRTGILPNQEAFGLYKAIVESSSFEVGGLHIYDGHIRESDFNKRKAICDEAFEQVKPLIQQIQDEGLPIPSMICGGSPSLPVHAQYPERTLSPGTYVFWDKSYASLFEDMAFKPAAVLMCRVISRPSENTLCLDLGHKAVASEMPHPRVHFFEIPDYEAVVHSEEHLVISCEQAADFAPGDCIYGIPAHVCPTTALHEKVWVVEDGQAKYTWMVTARKRLIEV